MPVGLQNVDTDHAALRWYSWISPPQNVAAPYLRPRHGPRVQSGIWRLKVQVPMRPGPVVVLDVGPSTRYK
jgi:hypothetical protein